MLVHTDENPKLLVLLALSLVTISSSRSTDKEHLERAAAQLNRLSAFRKTTHEKSKVTTEKLPDISKILLNDNNKKLNNQTNQKMIINADTMRRIDELATMAYKMVQDPKYNALMQERIKRSGSGDFISGIAGSVINGVVGASGGLSGGSSGPKAHDSYGVPVQPYGPPSYSLWDIKKAIINTLVQALKALAGGALAVKGSLIKGGGFLVQTTGRVISSAGEAAASLGTQIASSAVIGQSKPAYGPPGYSYNAPQQNQDYSYDGPPPNPDATHNQHTVHHHFGAPSDESPSNQPGLLIIKPTNNNEVQHQQYDHDNNHHGVQSQHSQLSLSALEESFGGVDPRHTKTITKLVGLVSGTSGKAQSNQHNEQVDYIAAEHKNQPPLSAPNHQHLHSQDTHNNPSSTLPNYNQQRGQQQSQQHDGSQQSSQSNTQGILNNENHQLAYQQIQSLLNPHLRLPINEPQDFTGQQSNYGVDISFESLKVPVIHHQYQNTIDFDHFEPHGLPTGYGIPMHHSIDMTSIHSNLERVGLIPINMKKMLANNIVVEKAVNFKIKDSKLHRI